MDLQISDAEVVKRNTGTVELTWKDIYNLDRSSDIVDITVVITQLDLVKLRIYMLNRTEQADIDTMLNKFST